MALCLVVEDQELQRRTLEATLRDAGYQVITAGTAEEGRRFCRSHYPDAVLLDLGLPDADNGLDVISDLLDAAPLTRIIILTGHDSVREAVEALRRGARHYLVKPWDREELMLIVRREVAAGLSEAIRRRDNNSEVFWGSNPEMRRVATHLERLKASEHTPVLIEGETGTGKEVVARELHRLSQTLGAFVALNCAAIPSELLESELFGHEKGAFTGAENRRRGVAELADDGTLFLDEIGEMAAGLQAKLLRFLQDRKFRRVGSETEQFSRCRLVSATHADLESHLKSGDFRSDLFFRLAVVRLHLPPLRERCEDILPLTGFLLERIAKRLGRRPIPLSPRAERAIVTHSWSGNVRELANRLERAMVLGSGDQIGSADLDLDADTFPSTNVPGEILTDPARLRTLLDEEKWNLAAVARRLGVERHHVTYRMQTFGIERPKAQ
ncbi:MAG: sigma-54 dependent transcriptional regulator [Thermoanaerobaculales bacterium]|nr:sigma-54 dependent transcriptional regulator [Thermoanaerobaculales bacterium]